MEWYPQDLQDQWQPQDIPEEFWLLSRDDGVPKTKGFEPDQWLTAWTFDSKTDGTKRYSIGHTEAPIATRIDEEVWRSRKEAAKRFFCYRGFCFWFWCGLFCAFVCLSAYFDLFPYGGVAGMRGGLGCLMWNSQRVNKVLKKKKKLNLIFKSHGITRLAVL